jgi:hypothetical protein
LEGFRRALSISGSFGPQCRIAGTILEAPKPPGSGSQTVLFYLTEANRARWKVHQGNSPPTTEPTNWDVLYALRCAAFGSPRVSCRLLKPIHALSRQMPSATLERPKMWSVNSTLRPSQGTKVLQCFCTCGGHRHFYGIQGFDRVNLNSELTSRSREPYGATHEAQSASYCRLLPPREIARSFSTNEMIGRGGGDRTKSGIEDV